MIAVVAGGYLGWQHFAQSPSATKPEPPPPVPVIAATVQQHNFPIVLTGIGTVDGAEHGDGAQPSHGAARQHRLQGGPVCQERRSLGPDRSAHLQAQLDEAEAALARDQAHLENAQINLGRYIPLSSKGLLRSSKWRRSRRWSPSSRPPSKRPGGDRICQDRAELYQARRAVRRGHRDSPARCREHHPPKHDTGPSSTTVRRRGHPGAADQRDLYLGCSRHSGGAGRSRKGPGKAIAFSQDGKTQLDTGKLPRSTTRRTPPPAPYA